MIREIFALFFSWKLKWSNSIFIDLFYYVTST